ncbi:MAG: c-type cytochrome [Pseudomonadota bacterium]
MADTHAKMTQATPQEVIISILAGLFAPLLAIFLIVQLVLGIQDSHLPDASSEVAQKATVERIKPFATLAAVDANAPKVEKSGQEVYDAVCASCHAAGALGAPKFDNKGDWAARIGKGFDTLVKHAIEGFNQMPARGGDGDLSDVEVARAVAYMANSAGANFKAPEPAAAAAGVAAKGDPAKGKAVYAANCAACHDAGVAGAPKLGDKAGWSARLAQGYDGLYQAALKGKNGMPAKGGNADLAEADLGHAVAYMFVEGGGKL